MQVCPVPLSTWLADSGGKGIQLVPVADGEAQLRTRWGPDGARVVLDTCSVKVLLPGISDPATLRMAADLCGQAALKERGEDWISRQDVMTPDMIRQLPAGHALVVRGGFAPVVARLGAAWRDPAYKRARHLGTAVAALLAPDPELAIEGGEPDLDDLAGRHSETADFEDDDYDYPWN